MDITSGPEVQQIIKIRSVRKLDVFLICQTSGPDVMSVRTIYDVL